MISSSSLQSETIKGRRDWRKIGFVLWLLLFALLLIIHWYPIRFGTLRLLLASGVLALWLGGLWLIWNYKTVSRVLAAGTILLAISLMLPARSGNPRALQSEYVRALQSYENTTYIWGGESRRGIDCSGLLRCALIDANFQQGLKTANPGLLREAFWLWWHDFSAKAMKEEYQSKTRFLFAAPQINQLHLAPAEYSALKPGDMAVTSSGVHVLAYIGNHTWIEADPNGVQGNRVIKVQTPARNAWFKLPVHIMRWRQLETNSERLYRKY